MTAMEHGGGGCDRGGFHRYEAISAVQDEDQFYGEDDDFDDLYNDVNVGEGFLHSLHGKEDPGGFSKEEETRSEPPPPPPPPPEEALPEKVPVIAGEPKLEKPLDRSIGLNEAGFRGSGELVVAVRPLAPQSGARTDLGQPAGEIQGHDGNNSFRREPYQRQGSSFGGEGFARQGGGGNANGGSGGGGWTTLFVGDLHWWTTDADLEAELCKYGQVKEIRFFDEKASGKSKGYCQVDFYDPAAAAACKEGMNGHVFNGRPCIVALASPFSVRRMGEAQVNKNRAQVSVAAQSQSTFDQKGRGGGGNPMCGNYGRAGNGGGSNNNSVWGRGGMGMGGRGPMGNMRNRMGPVGGRGIIRNGGIVNPLPPMLHPGAMLGQGFDPTGYGAAMGRMGGGYGGFPAGLTTAPFPGMLPSFPPMVAPHVNPAFFGRGMPSGGVGMWPDPNMGGWGGEEQSSYGEDDASDQQYGEGSQGKDKATDWDQSGASGRRHDRDKDMAPVQDSSERRHHDNRDRDWDRDRDRERDPERVRERDRHRDDRDRHGDHYRHRNHEPERNDEWDRGRSSRARSNSREVEHVKRRRHLNETGP